MRTRAWVATCLLFLPVAQAQDPFEIHVYEYEALRPGEFTFETHLNGLSHHILSCSRSALNRETSSLAAGLCHLVQYMLRPMRARRTIPT